MIKLLSFSFGMLILLFGAEIHAGWTYYASFTKEKVFHDQDGNAFILESVRGPQINPKPYFFQIRNDEGNIVGRASGLTYLCVAAQSCWVYDIYPKKWEVSDKVEKFDLEVLGTADRQRKLHQYLNSDETQFSMAAYNYNYYEQNKDAGFNFSNTFSLSSFFVLLLLPVVLILQHITTHLFFVSAAAVILSLFRVSETKLVSSYRPVRLSLSFVASAAFLFFLIASFAVRPPLSLGGEFVVTYSAAFIVYFFYKRKRRRHATTL